MEIYKLIATNIMNILKCPYIYLQIIHHCLRKYL
jgi:hypothetical protein